MDDIRENEPTTRDIERRAYGFYLLRGMVDGKDVEDWIRAEEELREARLNREAGFRSCGSWPQLTTKDINRQVKIGAPMVHVGNETDLCEVLYQRS